MPQPGMKVAVCFGGPSVEHDVSIISAQQLMAALEARHTPIPIYLARDGSWWTGDELIHDVSSFGQERPSAGRPVELRLGRAEGASFVVPSGSRRRGDEALAVDVVLNAIHGTGGEDGALLGALDHTHYPYAGGGVGPSAAAMNKATGKAVFRDAGLEVNPDQVLSREAFSEDPSAAARRLITTVGTPCFVKPISLGSSIGVTRCAGEEDLLEALELCFELDRQALVEPALDEALEINCAVLGRPGGELRASLCEQPTKDEGTLLSFEDKYMQGGGKGKGGGEPAGGAKSAGEGGGMAQQDRLIPAPISDQLTASIQEAALSAHRALGFAGVVRYDFLVDDPENRPRIVLNEANTVPGSFSFYLFAPEGLDFPALADELIDIALAEAAEARGTTRTFESVLLQRHSPGGGD